ncbi:MAG: hypothetical protein AAF517_19555, partial [Planctomycetota bacterium]
MQFKFRSILSASLAFVLTTTNLFADMAAFTKGTLYAVDDATGEATGFVDRDESQCIEEGETFLFLDQLFSVPTGMAQSPTGEIFVLEGGTNDSILVLPAPADGESRDGKKFLPSVFYENGDGRLTLRTPSDMVLGERGEIYVADDSSRAKHLIRFVDLDGDGTALGPDEVQVILDSGSLGIQPEKPSALAMHGGLLYYVDSETGHVVYLVRDINGDGDHNEEGETAIFHQDARFTDVRSLVSIGDALYAVNEDDGLIVCMRDVDGDGRAEAVDFVEPGGEFVVLRPTNAGEIPGLGLYVMSNADDAAYVVRDLDGDGVSDDVTPLFCFEGAISNVSASLFVPHVAAQD